jgi:4-amino-4-deoxy-L-arabinose transferase-like glycosyltransferase
MALRREAGARRAILAAERKAATPGYALAAVILVSLLWRLPSLFDPPWVNDEGTYFAVAHSMAHGLSLYRQVWENKPPAIYLLYGGVYHLSGPSLLTIRLVASLIVAGWLVVTERIGRRIAGPLPGLVATLLLGFLLGVPVLEGTTANAELFLGACTLLGVYLILVRQQPILAGVLFGLAILFKAVAAFDAAALAVWLLQNRRSDLWQFVAGFLLFPGAAVVWAAGVGILPEMVRHAFLYDIGYVGHTNGGGLPWLLLLKLGALGAATVFLRRAPFPVLWLLYASAGALFGGRFFGHYTLQALPALCLCVALVLRDRERLAARLLPIIPLVSVTVGGISALAGWSLAASGHDSILARRLQYYANFVRLAVGSESYSRYRGQIDDHVNRNLRVAQTTKGLPAGRLLVWGNTPWIYVLSGRLPATPYTSSLRQPEVPGETATLTRSTCRAQPAVLVLIEPLAPSFQALTCSRQRALSHYRLERRIDNAEVYAVRRSG